VAGERLAQRPAQLLDRVVHQWRQLNDAPVRLLCGGGRRQRRRGYRRRSGEPLSVAQRSPSSLQVAPLKDASRIHAGGREEAA
jgi:hypothetical protein